MKTSLKQYELVGKDGQILWRLWALSRRDAESKIPEKIFKQVYHIDEVLRG